MALDLTLAFQNNTPIKTIASLSDSNWLLVNIPSSTKRISVGSESSKIYVSFSYSDNAAKSSATDTVWVASGSLFTMAVPNSVNSFAVVSDSGAASDVAIILEEV